jgi:hypothetical protein
MIFKHIRIFNWDSSGSYMNESSFGGVTIAVEDLKPWILQTLNPSDFFEKKIGIAVCSKEDRFNKKTGRELAQSRAKLQRLTVQKVVKELDKTTVNMLDSTGNSYTFIKYNNANSVFFTGFNFKDSFEY